MRYSKFLPSLVLGAAITMTGCGTDDGANDLDTMPATETAAPGVGGTDPSVNPNVYDPSPGMTTDTATWGADTAGIGTGMDSGMGVGTGPDNDLSTPNPNP